MAPVSSRYQQPTGMPYANPGHFGGKFRIADGIKFNTNSHFYKASPIEYFGSRYPSLFEVKHRKLSVSSHQ
ncbi:hypothetical protein RB195_001745 [Necator americanus]|uniref:Uncharacterized protein n=1 Tax=Necator americanus TaxID=51031 RepID=A0ABR1DFR7_NECAM